MNERAGVARLSTTPACAVAQPSQAAVNASLAAMAAAAGAASVIAARQAGGANPGNTSGKPIREDNTELTSAEDDELRRIEQEGGGEEAVRTEGMYEAKQGTRGKIQKKPWFIIDPRTSKFVGYWDGISMVSNRPPPPNSLAAGAQRSATRDPPRRSARPPDLRHL